MSVRRIFGIGLGLLAYLASAIAILSGPWWTTYVVSLSWIAWAFYYGKKHVGGRGGLQDLGYTDMKQIYK